MKLEQIRNIALKVKEVLKPFCKRIEIVGSIRREKPECKDIELVCIPDSYQLEKFLIDMKYKGWIFKKNGAKYKQFLPDFAGVWIDLFITDEWHWGLTYLIRTGSKEFNIKMVNKLKSRDFTMIEGKLIYGNKEFFAEEEEAIFNSLGMNFVEPKDRI